MPVIALLIFCISTSSTLHAADDVSTIPVLNALVFTSESAGGGRIAGTPAQSSEPIDVASTPILQDRRFIDLMRPLIGERIDEQLIGDIKSNVIKYLKFSGQGIAYVGVPEQDVTDGVMQVVVIQPRVSGISVEGAVNFPEQSYRDAIRVQPGSVLNQKDLDDDLAWIKRSNPTRSAVVVLQPGRNVGETELQVKVTEDKLWSVRASVDNTGTRTSQNERLSIGATHANAFGLGHIASYNLTASPDFNTYLANSLTYTIPLASRDLLTFSSSYADIRARMPSPLSSKGYSATALVRYEKFLPTNSHYAHNLILGADYKIADTNLAFSDMPVFDNTTSIFQLVAGYNASLPDAYGRTAFNYTLFYSPGDVTGYNRDANYAASRAFAESSYHYQHLVIDRLTYLPREWTWTLNAKIQMASKNLLGSEQLAVTGTYGVRGFREALLYADEGIILRNEIAPPPFGLGQSGQMQPYGFVDAAHVSSKVKLPGETNARVSSVGIGSRFFFGNRFNLRAEIGRELSSNLNQDKDWRAHVGLYATF